KMEIETPVSYWKELFERYDKWINSFNACPILRINISDYNLKNDENSIEPILETIGHFIQLSRKWNTKGESRKYAIQNLEWQIYQSQKILIISKNKPAHKK